MELLFAHGLPVEPRTAHIMGIKLLDTGSLGHSTLCGSSTFRLNWDRSHSFTLRSRCFVRELVIASDWDCMIYHCIYSQASLLATACMQQQLAEHVFMQFFSARWEGLVQILTDPSHSTISYCCRPGESQPNGEVNSVARTQRLVQIRLCDESSWKKPIGSSFCHVPKQEAFIPKRCSSSQIVSVCVESPQFGIHIWYCSA